MPSESRCHFRKLKDPRMLRSYRTHEVTNPAICSSPHPRVHPVSALFLTPVTNLKPIRRPYLEDRRRLPGNV